MSRRHFLRYGLSLCTKVNNLILQRIQKILITKRQIEKVLRIKNVQMQLLT